MWLKLTATKQDVKVLINSDNINSIMELDGYTFICHCGAGDEDYSKVKESLAEIELMLMGRKEDAPIIDPFTRLPVEADPRERNVIGQDTRRDNELSESDWNLRYNKP